MPRGRRKPRTVHDELLTPTQLNMILHALRIGAPIKHAARAAGIPEGTVKSWLSRGRQEQARRGNGEEPNDVYDRHIALLDQVDKAEAEGAVANVVAIQRAANGGKWQAAAWLLSRRYPEEWGPPEQRIRVQTGEEDESPRESLMEELERMSERMGFGDDAPEADIGDDTEV